MIAASSLRLLPSIGPSISRTDPRRRSQARHIRDRTRMRPESVVESVMGPLPQKMEIKITQESLPDFFRFDGSFQRYRYGPDHPTALALAAIREFLGRPRPVDKPGVSR